MNNSETKQTLSGDILIVDDKPENLRVLDKMLTDKGYNVRKAINGNLALMSAQSTSLDVILLDIKMPEMDGYEVCEKPKTNPKTQDIPVIFVSALDETFNKIKAFELGGVDYITKPFQPEEVIARIENQLTIQRQKKQLIQEIEKRKEKEQQLQEEIEKRRETEEVLYQSRALINSVLNSSLDGVAALQSVRNVTGEIGDFRCLLVNPIISQCLGIKKEDLMGKLMLKRFLHKLDSDLFDSFVQVVETGKPLEKDFYYQHNQQNNWYHFIAVKLADGFAITVRDITQRKELELQLAAQNNKLQQSEAALQANLRKSLLLQKITEKIRSSLAETIANTVKRSGDLVARYGGEEFIIILPNTDGKGAKKVAQLISNEIEKLKIPHHCSKVSGHLTLSVGIASLIPTVEMSSVTLITAADKALYQAKKKAVIAVFS
ncbi:response regulator [Crocosphaera sp. UHCC 0190]|uniref:response regulator n=1 Tax=Crocosphaera sp. UHCC 0190 TaxID=3110246 RepID=UPI002B1E9D21|nr:response regulator [Crocosphaera sp. UHCC 0190]MEA5508825.1 response regulator [Crocosphaera sp. UHCC 0190]